MRIGIDARPLREKQTSGIPRYVRNMIRLLPTLDPNNEYILYSHKEIEGFAVPGPNFSFRYGAKTNYGSVWMQTELPFWLSQDKVDIFWGTQHILPLRMSRDIKAVLTVCDLVHYVFPKTMKMLNFILNKLIIPPSIHRTDAIVAISKWTLRDVVKYLHPQNKIMEVIYLGVEENFFPRNHQISRKLVEQRFGLKAPFLLTVGTFEPRKNIEGTLRAFSLIADKIPHDLVVVGQRGWKNNRTIAEIKKSDLIKRIHLLGYVEDQILPEIYSAADMFIFPSLYEGFGIPPLEAMASGVPVVCSNVSSLPEIVGDGGLLVNPHEPAEIAEGILTVINDPQKRYQLISQGMKQAAKFTWEKTAQELLDVFNRVYRLP